MEKVSAVYTVSVDISEEDVPVLMVAKRELVHNDHETTLRKTVINTIQGKTADQLHGYLTGELNVIPPEEALSLITHYCPQDSDDEEVNHMKADDILCKLLNNLGYGDVVKYYMSLKKYYA